jgi:hypothetical protein
VQVIGPSAARLILLCTSVVSTNEHGLKAHARLQMIADARDG